MAGYRGKTGDCVVRSIAIATGLPYQQIYDLVNGGTHRLTEARKEQRENGRLQNVCRRAFNKERRQ